MTYFTHYILIGILLLSTEVQGQSISFTNRSEVTLNIAVATYDDIDPSALREIRPQSTRFIKVPPRSNGERHWKTIGWYELKPGTIMTLNTPCMPNTTAVGEEWIGYYIDSPQSVSLNVTSSTKICPSVIGANSGYSNIQFEKYLQVEIDTDFTVEAADINRHSLYTTFQNFQVSPLPEGWELEVVIQ